MKVIIAGSRHISLSAQAVHDIMVSANMHYHRGQVEKYGYKYHMTEVVCGMARGVDTSGDLFAKFYRIPVRYFPADWPKYGKSAGARRNREMAEYGDALIIVWDGRSRGSGNMKQAAVRAGIPVYEVVFRGWDDGTKLVGQTLF